jgi:carotenoid cleavage dioxygenase-like enzyme
VGETPLDDQRIEFPRADESRIGNGNGGLSGIVKYDLAANRSARFECAGGQIAGEFVFVAEPERGAEDAGWIMGFVYDQTGRVSTRSESASMS